MSHSPTCISLHYLFYTDFTLANHLSIFLFNLLVQCLYIFQSLLPALPCLPPWPLHSSLKPLHRPFSPFYSFLCPAQRLMQFQNSFMFQIYFCTRIFGLMCLPVWPARRPKCIFLYCCRCYFNCHVAVTAEKILFGLHTFISE